MTAVERHRVAAPGACLALALHLPDAAPAVPCVVACHGLGASKDSDKYLLLGAEFAAAGLALARFDFRGCGESTGVEDGTSVATRLEDARAVLAFLRGHPRLSGCFGLLGSSLGGYVALHLAASERLPVVTWNAPAHLRGLTSWGARPPAHPDPRAAGVRALLAELGAGRHLEAPAGVGRHLAIQAGADEVVPPEHGRLLYERAQEPRDLVVLAGADHRLTAPAHRRDAVVLSLAWLRRFLPGSP